MGTGPNSRLTLVPDPWLGYRTAAVSRAASGRACISTGPLVPSLFIFAGVRNGGKRLPGAEAARALRRFSHSP